jgi:hypothetical protein
MALMESLKNLCLVNLNLAAVGLDGQRIGWFRCVR